MVRLCPGSLCTPGCDKSVNANLVTKKIHQFIIYAQVIFVLCDKNDFMEAMNIAFLALYMGFTQIGLEIV